MSTEIRVSGDTYEAALEEGLQQLGIPAEAVEISRLEDEHEDTLPGAAPLAGTTLRLRVKDDVLLSKAREHLKRILQLIGVENPQIEVRNRRGGVTLNIVAAQDGPLIIGRNGQNLEALQVLINRMVVHGGRDLVMPFAVDSEGYRERRLTRLEQTAERAARQALRENREVELEPMSASERRIVHTHVKTIRGVHTISRGEGYERHIVVTPGMPDASSAVLRPATAGYRGEGERQSAEARKGRGAEWADEEKEEE